DCTQPGVLKPIDKPLCFDTHGKLTSICYHFQSLLGFSLAHLLFFCQFYYIYLMITWPWNFGPSHILRSILFILLISYTAFYTIMERNTAFRGMYLGGRIRRAKAWNSVFSYFPVHMVLSDELIECARRQNISSNLVSESAFPGLPADKNYLLGYHPHGLFTMGAAACFGTEAVGFSKVFPELRPWCAVHPNFFRFPLLREFALFMGLLGATYNEIRYRLDPKICGQKGNLVLVAVGGAAEMLETRPDRYTLYLKRRFGIFKLALQTGSSLIPCLSFGDTKLYNIIRSKKGTFMRKVEQLIHSWTDVPMVLFYANGLAPYRKPIYAVVGAPIPCERVSNPTREQVAEVKLKYVEALRKMFDRYKIYFDPDAGELEMV
ncbi:unnamed protein product, partial [Calicophoron daubneyi]